MQVGPEQFPRVHAFECGLNRPERISSRRFVYSGAELLDPALVRCFGCDIVDQCTPGVRLADLSKESERYIVSIEEFGGVQIFPAEKLLRVSNSQKSISVQAIMGQPLRSRFDRLDD